MSFFFSHFFNSFFNSAPQFTNLANGQTICINENTTFVVDANATDPNCDTLTFSIAGGADSARFTINPHTGVLSFITPPDYEGAKSAIGNDQIYDVTLRVSDGRGGCKDVCLYVKVLDVIEPDGVVNGTGGNDHMGLGYTDAQHDQITNGADSIQGGAGNDAIYAAGGDDTIDGGSGNDNLFGQDGSDVIYGGTGNDSFLGGAGNDTIYGGDGDDQQWAGDLGDDLVYGGNGNDVLSGDFGRDTLYGDAGNDAIEGHEGADLIFGGDGDDYIMGADLNYITYGQYRTLTQASVGYDDGSADTLHGDAGNDTIFGNKGDDVIFGGGGADTIVGGADNDLMYGGAGSDRFMAFDGFGNDTIFGGNSDETGAGDLIDLSETTQNTVLTYTGNAAGTILSAGGNVQFSEIESVFLGAGDDLISGNAGNDVVNSGAGNDTLNGGAGDDNLNGGAGDDLFVHNLAQNAGSSDVYDGSAGFDELHMEVTAAEWANPAFQTDVAAFLGHIASGSPAPFIFGSTGLTVISIEKFTINVDGVPIDPANALVTANADVLAASEDGPAVSVDLLANDTVEDRAGLVQILGTSAYGDLSLAPALLATPQTAVLTFTPNAAAQTLRAGEVVVETITYQVTDVDGNTATSTVTITLTGANDGATITGLAMGEISEDALAPVSGVLTVADVDTGEAVFQTPTGLVGIYGSFAFDAATGAWAYTPNAGNADLESLAEGQQVSDQLTVTSLDGTAVQTIVVTITGTNDAPTLAAGVLDAVEDGAVVTLDLADLGNDIDNLEDGSTLTYTISGAPAVGTAQITGTTLSYDIGAGFQHLAEGETDTVTITVTATDAFGASVSNDVTVTITGTNDAPVITSGLQDTPTSGVNGDGQLELTGSIGFTDLDLTDTHIISATSASGTAVSVTLAMAATNGALGVVNWAYTAGAQSPLGGQDTITFIISDTKLGGTAQGSLTIDLPSGNGAPDVSFPMQIFSLAGEGALPEDVNAYFLDPESDPLTAQADPAQIYSGMTFNGTSEIVFNPDDDAFQFLTFGEQYVGTYTFLLSDGTTTQTAEIEWTIEGYRTKVAGSQDADALFGDDFTPTLIEGGAGDDTMTGGFVENIFAYFAAGDGFDLITNFVVGQDKIGVSASAFGGNLVGGADATVLVASDFAQVDAGGTDGVFILQTDGQDGTLYWDADGGLGDNAVAIAQLSGVTDLTSDDFFIFI